MALMHASKSPSKPPAPTREWYKSIRESVSVLVTTVLGSCGRRVVTATTSRDSILSRSENSVLSDSVSSVARFCAAITSARFCLRFSFSSYTKSVRNAITIVCALTSASLSLICLARSSSSFISITTSPFLSMAWS